MPSLIRRLVLSDSYFAPNLVSEPARSRRGLRGEVGAPLSDIASDADAGMDTGSAQGGMAVVVATLTFLDLE